MQQSDYSVKKLSCGNIKPHSHIGHIGETIKPHSHIGHIGIEENQYTIKQLTVKELSC